MATVTYTVRHAVTDSAHQGDINVLNLTDKGNVIKIKNYNDPVNGFQRLCYTINGDTPATGGTDDVYTVFAGETVIIEGYDIPTVKLTTSESVVSYTVEKF